MPVGGCTSCGLPEVTAPRCRERLSVARCTLFRTYAFSREGDVFGLGIPVLIGKFTGAVHPRADDGRVTAVTQSEPSKLPATVEPHFAQRSEASA